MCTDTFSANAWTYAPVPGHPLGSNNILLLSIATRLVQIGTATTISQSRSNRIYNRIEGN